MSSTIVVHLNNEHTRSKIFADCGSWTINDDGSLEIFSPDDATLAAFRPHAWDFVEIK